METNERIQALMLHTGDTEADNYTEGYNEQTIEHDGAEYLVVTDSEADDMWEESLDNYIDECILPELPEWVQNYFDDEGWKSDARHDGRGNSLSSYDGFENEENFEGTTYYIYRMN